MKRGRWVLPGLISVAAIGLWLLLAGPARVLGVDAGQAGMVLLITSVWMSLYAIHRMPRGELDTAIAPGEWRAWVGVGFMAVAIGYLVLHIDVFRQTSSIYHNHDANAVGRNLALLLVAWAVISSTLRRRWHAQVQEDERDRQILVRSCQSAYYALVVGIVALALLFGFSPVDKLQWATPLMIANSLIFMLMASSLVSYLVAGVSYWRDRR